MNSSVKIVKKNFWSKNDHRYEVDIYPDVFFSPFLLLSSKIVFLERLETFLRKKIWNHFFGVDAVHIFHRSKPSQNTIFELKSKNGEKIFFRRTLYSYRVPRVIF